MHSKSRSDIESITATTIKQFITIPKKSPTQSYTRLDKVSWPVELISFEANKVIIINIVQPINAEIKDAVADVSIRKLSA